MTDAGGDRPPASGAKTFNRWLAGGIPAFLAALLVANLGSNPWFVLLSPRRGTGVRVWWAPTVAHGPLIRRLLTPILVLAYTAG